MKTPNNIVFRVSSDAAPTNDNLNAAAASNQLAYSFIAEETSLSTFWIRVGAVAGTDGLRKILFELQADSTGKPSDSALASYEVAGGWSVGQREISPGWSNVALTLGARYWIVCKNTAEAPTVDYVGFSKSGLVYPTEYSAVYNKVCAQFVKRQWNGTNWTTSVLNHATALTVKFVSGALFGCPSAGTVGYDSAWLASSTRRIGAEFQIPANSPPMNVVAVGLSVMNAPLTLLYAYRNRNQIAVSPYAADTPEVTNRILTVPMEFVAYPGDWIAIMTGTTVASSVQVAGQNITDHADFHSMKQWKNRAVKLDNDTTWTALETRCPSFMIHLHPTQPFLPVPLNRRRFFNQR